MTLSAYSIAADLLDPPERRWLRDPVLWAEERLKIELWSKQKEILYSVRDNDLTAVHSSHEVGKGLALDTPLPTPTGWTTMGELRVGDELLDEYGMPCTVRSLSPVWNRPCYQVKFGDDSTLTTDDGHQWSVLPLEVRGRIKQRRKAQGLPAPHDWREFWEHAETVDAPELFDRQTTNSNQNRFGIPVTAPLDLPHNADLSIDPYVLGAWLGDGTSAVAHISCSEDKQHVLNRIKASGENLVKVPSADITWSMAGELPDRPLFTHRLRDLGVRGDKHIPTQYLRASIDQRIALLHGLMDTDGFCKDSGVVCIDLMNERLVSDVVELIRSLGSRVRLRSGRTYLNGRNVGTRYRLAWSSYIPPFSAPRKLAKWKAPASGHASIHTVSSVVEVPSVPTRCVTVSSPSSLFLAGRSFVPTHNSFTAALTICWWLDTHTPGTAFALSSAPTFAQVKAILWREINKMHKAGGLIGRTNQTEWWISGEQVGVGRKPADDNPDAFQGIHAKHMLLVYDEACGIPKTLWDSGSSLVASSGSRTLAIGNPDDPSGEFARRCASDSDWNVIHVGYQHTPNFTGENVSAELKSRLISVKWVEQKKKDWGEDSALFQSKCMGIFPTTTQDGVIPLRHLQACRYLELPASGVREGGIDVGAGGDRTVIRERVGMRAGRELTFVDSDPMRTIGKLVETINEWGLTRVKVDSIGIGWSLTGRLRELSSQHNHVDTAHAAEVVGVNFAEASGEPDRFINRRAEVWWNIGREYSRLNRWDLADVDDDVFAELAAPNYDIMDSKGKIKIEPKELVKKRLGRSPDRAEALLLAFVGGDWVASFPGLGMGSTSLLR